MLIEIEKMKSSDAIEVAQIHMCAFKTESLGVFLGKEFILAKNKWFIKKSNAIALVAKLDTKIIGYAFGAPVGYEKLMYLNLLLVILKIFFTQPHIAFNKKLLSAFRSKVRKPKHDNENAVCLHDIPEPIIKLAVVAVSQDYERHGVGTLLINAFEQEAANRDFKSIILKTRENNIAANTMYARNKWINIDDKSSKEMLYYIKIL